LGGNFPSIRTYRGGYGSRGKRGMGGLMRGRPKKASIFTYQKKKKWRETHTQIWKRKTIKAELHNHLMKEAQGVTFSTVAKSRGGQGGERKKEVGKKHNMKGPGLGESGRRKCIGFIP